MNDSLEAFLAQARPALGLADDEVDVDLLLGLARDVAHGVARPAAPVSTYLLGLAVGRGASPAETAALLTALAQDPTPP